MSIPLLPLKRSLAELSEDEAEEKPQAFAPLLCLSQESKRRRLKKMSLSAEAYAELRLVVKAEWEHYSKMHEQVRLEQLCCDCKSQLAPLCIPCKWMCKEMEKSRRIKKEEFRSRATAEQERLARERYENWLATWCWIEQEI